MTQKLSNYRLLKEHEIEKAKLKASLTEQAYNDVEADYDFYVKCARTGKIGYAETYIESPDVCVTVPDEGLAEYVATKERFNHEYIIQ